MNTGAFGEGFPYTNFHDLNMDWIIKIAKDFLDQYTHIQQVIADGETSLQQLTDSGLEALQNKKDELEALLDEWYNTHSEDIALQLASALQDLNTWYNTHSEDISSQLASALQDLNTWYTTHEHYLDNILADNIASFNQAATQKGNETLASIPDDYTFLADKVSSAMVGENNILNILSNIKTVIPFSWEDGHIDTTTGEDIVRTPNQRTKGFTQIFGKTISVKSTNNNVVCYLYEYDKNFAFLEYHTTTTSEITPQNSNAYFVRVSTYSSTITQDLGSYITGSWINNNDLSKTIINKILQAIDIVNETISGTNGYSTNVYMPILSGRNYSIINNTSSSIVFNLIKDDGTFDIIETIATGVTFTYTPTTNYYGIRIYFAVDGSVQFISNDMGVYRSILNNNDNIEEIRKNIIDDGVANEYVILQNTNKVKLNIPNRIQFEIATTDGSVFESNTVTMYANDGSTVLNTWGLSQYSGNKREITNNSGNGSYVKLTNIPPVGIKITVFSKKKQPIKIRVMQYNIGKFNYGHSGGLSSDVQTKIANYKKFLGEYQPDICGLIEYTEYIDQAQNYNSDDTIFNDLYYTGEEDFDIEMAVKSNYGYRKFDNFYIRDNNNETAGSYVEYYADIHNKELIIVSGAILAGKPSSTRSEGFENLMTKYADTPNVIILIDTNVISAEEHALLVNTAITNGYKVANGGYFGTFDTYNLNSGLYHKIDNILVKGDMNIKNVIVPDVYSELSSDHYPVIADIEFYR